jgi:hypothetical protein
MPSRRYAGKGGAAPGATITDPVLVNPTIPTPTPIPDWDDTATDPVVLNKGQTKAAIREAVGPRSTSSTAFSPVLDDAGGWIRTSAATAVAVTIPSNATVAFPVRTLLTFQQGGAGQITFTAAGGVTIEKPASFNAKSAEEEAVVQLYQRAANVWVLFGYLEAA